MIILPILTNLYILYLNGWENVLFEELEVKGLKPHPLVTGCCIQIVLHHIFLLIRL